MTTPPQSNTPYAMKEIKKHKTKKSTWMVIHNDVYDVTSFLQEHPGGEESLLEVAGKDATQAFEDVGHSPDARELMKKYKIGYLPEEERTTHVESCQKSLTPKSSFKQSQSPQVERKAVAIVVPRESPSNWKKYLLIALAVVIVAAVVAKKMNANK